MIRELTKEEYGACGVGEIGEWTRVWSDGESVIALSGAGGQFVAHSNRCTDANRFVRMILHLVKEAKKMGATELRFGEEADSPMVEKFLKHGFEIEKVILRGSI